MSLVKKGLVINILMQFSFVNIIAAETTCSGSFQSTNDECLQEYQLDMNIAQQNGAHPDIASEIQFRNHLKDLPDNEDVLWYDHWNDLQANDNLLVDYCVAIEVIDSIESDQCLCQLKITCDDICNNQIEDIFITETNGLFLDPFPTGLVTSQQCQNVLTQIENKQYDILCQDYPYYISIKSCAGNYAASSSSTTTVPVLTTLDGGKTTTARTASTTETSSTAETSSTSTATSSTTETSSTTGTSSTSTALGGYNWLSSTSSTADWLSGFYQWYEDSSTSTTSSTWTPIDWEFYSLDSDSNGYIVYDYIGWDYKNGDGLDNDNENEKKQMEMNENIMWIIVGVCIVIVIVVIVSNIICCLKCQKSANKQHERLSDNVNDDEGVSFENEKDGNKKDLNKTLYVKLGKEGLEMTTV